MLPDPLPSWHTDPPRDRILTFLRAVSPPGSPQFVPAEERIAVFDNDGTLWSEQPMVVQLAFALDRARALGVPVDRADRMARGHAALLDLLTRTHTGMDTEAFAALVRRFAAFGNSDGDLAMLRWVTSGPGLRLGMLVHHDTTTPRHHDDARREVAYDRSSPFGRLDRGLEEAPQRAWGLISMRTDWAKIYAGSEGP